MRSVVLLVVGLSLASGCGSENGSEDSQDPDASASSRSKEQSGSTVQGPSERDGERVLRAADGTPAIILPPKPTATRTRPSPSCVKEKSSGESQGVLLPPTPGVSVRAVDQRVVTISYRVARGHSACKPTLLRLTIQTSKDGASITSTYPLRALVGDMRVAVPDHFTASPDVVRASTVTATGTRSNVSSVNAR